jgi:hypothetical protein
MSDINIKLRKVDGMTRGSVPDEGVTIFDDFDFDIDSIDYFDIYLREPQDCPFGRGNWLIDIYSKDDRLLCIRLPMEMSESQVFAYAKPLIDFSRRGMH